MGKEWEFLWRGAGNVIPAKAGIQPRNRVPAYAGTTNARTPSPENSAHAFYAAFSISFFARRVKMAAVVFTIGTTL